MERDFGVVERSFLTSDSFVIWGIKSHKGHLPPTQFTQGVPFSTELAIIENLESVDLILNRILVGDLLDGK